jgi:hypothetical protein
MRLHRLRVQNFAAIREMAIEFGPGLNILYGPNDLGKSTLADAIRLVLLLPHASTHCEPYRPWSGASDPFVDLTFETEAQRFWRVRKQFGKGGSSLLQESRNGQDFEDIQRARGVDARLREILGWGIPEPGGPGAGKGLPTSFLATALLSTQAEVTDVLRGSLQEDPTATGKERITAALQAVAQDPLFIALLRETQARRDEGYTDKGAKKTARGSVFKAAADRVRETREEKEGLQKIVDDSEGVERELRELIEKRSRLDQDLADTAEQLAVVEQLARQAAERATAAESVRVAREKVLRIQKMDQDVADAARKAGELAAKQDQAEGALKGAQAAEAVAVDALNVATEAVRSATGSDPDMADTLARQALDLRRVAAERAAQEAQQEIDAAGAAQKMVDDVTRAEDEHRKQEAEAARAREKRADAARAEQTANDEIHRCDLLERAWEARSAERQAASAQAEVDRNSALRADWTRVAAERAGAAEHRAGIIVPSMGSLAAMRKLLTELASARGALDVGLVMTVIPTALVHLQVRRDGIVADEGVIAQPLEIEANTEVEVDIADLATVRVRGGRREAQERVRFLEGRWDSEVLPHLRAAGVEDLDALDAKIVEARELDSRIKALDGDLEFLQRQITDLAGAAEALRGASARVAACRLELEDVVLDSLMADLDSFGPDPGVALRVRRQKASKEAEGARATANEAATAQALAEERARHLRVALEAAVVLRDAALSEFPSGLAAGAAVAQESLRVALEEQEKVRAELASLQKSIDARREQLAAVLAGARETAENARRAVEKAQGALVMAIADHASEQGRLAELRKLREAEDLSAAERDLREMSERHDALPAPERVVSLDEVTAARDALARTERSLETTNQEIHFTQGRLQQVGGAVARERLRDAIEAFELAERQDREIEADYEAWKLLLDQLKEAESAQSSNLGQALAPAIAGQFQALTKQRYQNVQLNPHLGTDGVFVAGAVRSTDLISVGTREQLSTLYRLCLGEYLRTAVVLDDQLVQSDDTRMEWFRGLLAEKARSFQIVVFTCRPGDYLAPGAMVEGEGLVQVDSDEGFVRAIDLGRVVGGR